MTQGIATPQEPEVTPRSAAVAAAVPATAAELAVCVAAPRKAVYSETFIADHVRLLPMPVVFVYGDPWLHDEQDRLIERRADLASRLRRRIGQRLGQGTDRLEAHDAHVAAHLKRHHVGAVLAEFGPTAVRLLRPAATAGVPLVAHFHGYDAYARETLAEYRDGYARLFREAAAIVGVSTDMCRQLRDLGAPAAKVVRITYGIDARAFGGGDPAAAPPHFLAVGRFVEKKAPQLTLLAFAEVLRAEPSARLTMAGDGPLWGACVHLARAVGIDHAVRFAGAVPREEVAAAMRSARAFVQHSVRAENGDSEGTPVAVLEAMAAGLPVIATRHTGIADVVAEGETGFLVGELDVGSMAARMRDVARDPALAARLGAAGRARALDQFESSKSIRQLADVIGGVTGGAIHINPLAARQQRL